MTLPAFPPGPLPCTLLLDLEAAVAAQLALAATQRATFRDLDVGLLARVRADHIVMPLLTEDHDATVVIERLQALGYAGRITVIATGLPKARMVEAELRALGPGQRLTLLVL